MSYHTTNLGQFAGHVEEYADLNGFIPEPGDDPDTFSYPTGYSFTPDEWLGWCIAAELATKSAMQAWEAHRDHAAAGR